MNVINAAIQSNTMFLKKTYNYMVMPRHGKHTGRLTFRSETPSIIIYKVDSLIQKLFIESPHNAGNITYKNPFSHVVYILFGETYKNEGRK